MFEETKLPSPLLYLEGEFRPVIEAPQVNELSQELKGGLGTIVLLKCGEGRGRGEMTERVREVEGGNREVNIVDENQATCQLLGDHTSIQNQIKRCTLAGRLRSSTNSTRLFPAGAPYLQEKEIKEGITRALSYGYLNSNSVLGLQEVF